MLLHGVTSARPLAQHHRSCPSRYLPPDFLNMALCSAYPAAVISIGPERFTQTQVFTVTFRIKCSSAETDSSVTISSDGSLPYDSISIASEIKIMSARQIGNTPAYVKFFFINHVALGQCSDLQIFRGPNKQSVYTTDTPLWAL
jgi:hypothetical protein